MFDVKIEISFKVFSTIQLYFNYFKLRRILIFE